MKEVGKVLLRKAKALEENHKILPLSEALHLYFMQKYGDLKQAEKHTKRLLLSALEFQHEAIFHVFLKCLNFELLPEKDEKALFFVDKEYLATKICELLLLLSGSCENFDRIFTSGQFPVVLMFSFKACLLKKLFHINETSQDFKALWPKVLLRAKELETEKVDSKERKVNMNTVALAATLTKRLLAKSQPKAIQGKVCISLDDAIRCSIPFFWIESKWVCEFFMFLVHFRKSFTDKFVLQKLLKNG